MNSPEIYYLHISGEQRGPYTIRHIDHLLNSGLIVPETLYWREGLEQWEPVTNLVAIRIKPNPWRKITWALAVLAVLAVPAAIFGPVVVEGWQEANQHSFTSAAAYWRARDVVRNQALPPGGLVQFADLEEAQVQLRPPDGAQVVLPGELTLRRSETRPARWRVELRFDPETREWSGQGVPEEVAAL